MVQPLVLMYTTVATQDEAATLSRVAIENRLAACANISASLTAVYEWEGALEQSSEVSILFKTTMSKAEPLRHYILSNHPYKIPALITWTASCNEAFFSFAQQATGADGQHQSQGTPELQLGIYRHYKGKEYQVLDIARDEATHEQLVIYRALYGNFQLWARPLSVFEEVVEHEGKAVKRFVFVRIS